jgi:hypothetical protein
MSKGLDYAGGRPSAAAIKAAGFDFVVRYLTPGGPGLPGKLLLPTEADDLRANGVDIAGNVELYANRMAEGFGSGVADATTGYNQHRACGGPANRPIYFSADWDVQPGQLPSVFEYLRGAAGVIGANNVGIYGGFRVVQAALAGGHAAWGWQTGAWSQGLECPTRHIHQDINQVTVDGVTCDTNYNLTEDFGQWGFTPPIANTGDDDMLQSYRNTTTGAIVTAGPGHWRQVESPAYYNLLVARLACKPYVELLDPEFTYLQAVFMQSEFNDQAVKVELDQLLLNSLTAQATAAAAAKPAVTVTP